MSNVPQNYDKELARKLRDQYNKHLSQRIYLLDAAEKIRKNMIELDLEIYNMRHDKNT